MLTRLRVKGFKSLEDVEIRFGPFTCVAGINGVGKSNLFDAIEFLQKLASVPIMEAAASIRNNGIASLFTQTATRQAQTMEFEADMLVGKQTVDDFGRTAEVGASYLRYRLCLQYVPGGAGAPETIKLLAEHLSGLPRGGLAQALGFDASKKFLASVYHGAGSMGYIGTDEAGGISLRSSVEAPSARRFSAGQASRTTVSSVNVLDYPAMLAARREMQSWMTLRLELSALRRPDDFFTPGTMAPDGGHLPAALARLSSSEAVANQLAMLVADVDEIFVRVDEARQTKTLCVKLRSGVVQDAGTLSDGTLRFLALAVIAADREAGALVCVEEPENGIHPGRVGTMLELFKGAAVDPAFAVDEDNPLRQIIVNTHSPVLVRNLLPEDVVICQNYRFDGASLSVFSPLQNTWRDRDAAGRGGNMAVGLGSVLAYLDGDSGAAWPPSDKLNIAQEYKQQLVALASK
jgi:predicted ATPase